MKGSRAELESRLSLCDAYIAEPGKMNPLLRELLRAQADEIRARIRRELARRDARRKTK